MKNMKMNVLILLIVAAVASLVYAFSFSQPQIRVYRFGQAIDNEIADADLSLEQTREELLDLLQRDVADLIRIGTDYEASLNIEREFGHFQETMASLSLYMAQVLPVLNDIIDQTDFEGQLSRAASLNLHADLAVAFLEAQQERLRTLSALNGAVADLYGQLQHFESYFYEADPWVSIPYFQSLLEQFEAVAGYHGTYVEALDSYSRTKTQFYLALRENL